MTIKDIARLSGYAVGTVSRTLNNHPNVSPAAREKIMAVVAKQNFHLNNNAKHLKQQASNGIAVVVKGTQNMLFATIVERIQEQSRENGYALMLYYIDEDADELEQALLVSRERRPQGIIFLGSNFDYFRQRFSFITEPCVLLTNSAQCLGFENLSSVCTDDASAAAEAVNRLVALGHTQIGVLGGRMKQSDTAQARFEGCKRAFAAHGLPFHEQKHYETARFAMHSGYKAMGRLLDKMNDLTAVFVMSDVQAVGAIRALHDRGLRVPEDISVMGFDGIELSQYLTPQLTTIAQNARKMADRGMEILFQRIAADAPAVHELVPFTFCSGESVRSLLADGTI